MTDQRTLDLSAGRRPVGRRLASELVDSIEDLFDARNRHAKLVGLESLDRLPHSHNESTSEDAAHGQLDSGRMEKDLFRVLRAAYYAYGVDRWWTPETLCQWANLDLMMVRKRCSNALALGYIERDPKLDDAGNPMHTSSGKPIWRRIGKSYANRITPDGETVARLAESVRG